MTLSIDAVPLPPPFAEALRLLVARSLALPGTAAERNRASRAVMAALFGADAPVFGQVRRLSERDLKAACAKAGIDDAAVPVTGYRELAEILPRVAPDVPICGACGEFPLSDSGGRVMTLPHGAACPFCDGTVALLPMTLRKVAWTDGRLVEPQTAHDLRVRPGERIPLDDEGIVAWTGGWMHLRLERGLKDAGLPVYGLLAYMHLHRRAFDTLEDASVLLHEPAKFGLADAERLGEAIAEARGFLAAREQTNMPERPRLPFIRTSDPDMLPRLEVAGRSYLVEGRIGSGDKAEVYRAAWDHPLTERVVIKVGRDASVASLMAREAAFLSSLRDSRANGTPFFVGLLPEVVATGSHDGRPVTVFRYKNRYDWTLADVIREYPGGVDPETMVWMWNRTLTLVGWLQMNAVAHGALVPGHMLIHPVNHGMTFIDWAYAARTKGRKAEAAGSPGDAYAAFCPGEVLRKEAATAETDIAMSARCMIAVLGGNPADGSLPRSVPGPIADVLRVHARYDEGTPRIADAFALEKEFGRIAEGVFGPRRYHPFTMPARSR